MCFGCLSRRMIVYAMVEMRVTTSAGFLWSQDCFFLFVVCFGWFVLQMNDHKYECILYNLLETFIYQGWQDKARQLIRKIFKATLIYRKSALDYATLWPTFRNCFSFENNSCVFWNTIILKTIRSWKPLSHEFTYKVISTANILHTLFSFLKLSVHS